LARAGVASFRTTDSLWFRVGEKADPRVKLLAFGATYSRDEQKNGPNEGRNFVRRCFDLGIGRYTDGYSLHYTWGLDQKDFTRFFREQADRTGGGKLLVNSEDSGHGEPYTIVKMFARNLFLYGYERVYYYLARDWSENGALQPTGLFDIDWNPKVRLLAYAASVDAMRGRRLTGLASPAGGVEAYVLERDPDRGGDGPAYSVVMWRNGAAEGLEVSSVGKASDDSARIISVPGTVSAWSWRLDPIAFDRAKPEFRLAGYEPVVVFTDVKPEWKMVGPEEWLKAVYRAKGNGKIPMPAR